MGGAGGVQNKRQRAEGLQRRTYLAAGGIEAKVGVCWLSLEEGGGLCVQGMDEHGACAQVRCTGKGVRGGKCELLDVHSSYPCLYLYRILPALQAMRAR